MITSEQKRRRYTPEDKARFIALAMQPGYTVSLVAQQYGIKPSLLFKLKRLMIDGGKSAITAGDEVVNISGVKALDKKVDIAYAIATTGRYPIIRIAEVVCVSRSNLYERLRKKRHHRSARYGKNGDARLLPLIRQICSERAINDYRRVTAYLSRALKEQS